MFKRKRETNTDLKLQQQPFHDDFIITMCKVFNWIRWIGIIGPNRIKWKLYGLFLFCLLLAIEVQSIKKVVRALAGVAVDTSGQRSVAARLAGLMFYTTVLLGFIQSNRLSFSWNTISVYWASSEWSLNIRDLPSDKTLKKRMYRITIISISSASVVFLLDVLFAINFQCELPLCLKKIILKTHGFMLRESEYSDWIGIVTLFMSVVANTVWIFQDLLIILISMGLTSRYQRLNECVAIVAERNEIWNEDEEVLQVYTWRKIREAYLKQAMLVRLVDNSLGGLILVYNFFNFYFVCLQLFYVIVQGISNKGPNDFIFIIDLIFVSGRTIYTVLSAANVNKYSTMALPYIFECHKNVYNIEVERLQKQLTKNTVALTGMGFYNINRSIVLQVMGTIVTYVLVLVQYDA